MSGYVLYEGPSMLDGAPIVVIATLETTNRKTGDMVQTWILRADMEPTEAIWTHSDVSVCGMCPHRHNLGGACYVLPHQAPLAVYRAWKRGIYPVLDHTSPKHTKSLQNRKARLGAYGDPSAAPYAMWKAFVALCIGFTGYTHQSKHPMFDPRMLELCMLSVDTAPSAIRAHKVGKRTFRVIRAGQDPLPWEIECLADSQDITCKQCGICNGGMFGPSVYITVHGSRAARF